MQDCDIHRQFRKGDLEMSKLYLFTLEHRTPAPGDSTQHQGKVTGRVKPAVMG